MEGCLLDQMTIFVDLDQVLAEGPAPRHMDNGHAVLEHKPSKSRLCWGFGAPTTPWAMRLEAHPGRVSKGHLRQAQS